MDDWATGERVDRFHGPSIADEMGYDRWLFVLFVECATHTHTHTHAYTDGQAA